VTAARHVSGQEDDVKARAYALWENEGRPDGRHLEHWLRASQELAGSERAATPPKAVGAPGDAVRGTVRRAGKPKTKAAAE